MAPQPKDAAASDDTKKSGNGIKVGMRKKLTPAQEVKNSNHHERSR
jgi:hypothetical protein